MGGAGGDYAAMRVLPWPSKAERRKRIEAERANLEQAQDRTREARALADNISAHASENHFSDIIVRSLRPEGHR